jgi:hypothetical protein
MDEVRVTAIVAMRAQSVVVERLVAINAPKPIP